MSFIRSLCPQVNANNITATSYVQECCIQKYAWHNILTQPQLGLSASFAQAVKGSNYHNVQATTVLIVRPSHGLSYSFICKVAYWYLFVRVPLWSVTLAWHVMHGRLAIPIHILLLQAIGSKNVHLPCGYWSKLYWDSFKWIWPTMVHALAKHFTRCATAFI